MATPFVQNETGYTATARQVTYSASSNYDPAKLDNPNRAKINFALIAANIRDYKTMVTV